MFQTWAAFSAFWQVNHLRRLSTELHTDKPAQGAQTVQMQSVALLAGRPGWNSAGSSSSTCISAWYHSGNSQNWGFPFPEPLLEKSTFFFFFPNCINSIKRGQKTKNNEVNAKVLSLAKDLIRKTPTSQGRNCTLLCLWNAACASSASPQCKYSAIVEKGEKICSLLA